MFIETAGLTVHAQADGPLEAPPVLLLHSLGTSLHVWDEQARALADAWRVIRIDLRGHGLTGVPPGPYAIEQMARDALSVLAALGVARVHVGGLSIGGVVAQAMASLAPGAVASLMLCDTAMALPPAAMWPERAAAVRAHGVASIADAVMARWVTPGFAASPAATGLRQMLLRTDPEGYAGAAEALAAADRTEATRALRLPALVLVGDQDQATPLSSAEALRDAIPGARLAVLRGAAHIPTVEQPALVSAAMLEFLAERRTEVRHTAPTA